MLKIKKNTPSYRVLSMPLLAFVFACSKDEIGFGRSFTSSVIGNQNPQSSSVGAPEQAAQLTSSDAASSVALNFSAISTSNNLGSEVIATIKWEDQSSDTTFTMNESHNSPSTSDPTSAIFKLDQSSGHELIINGGGFNYGSNFGLTRNVGLIAIYWNVDDLKGNIQVNTQEPTNHLKIHGNAQDQRVGDDVPKFYKLAEAKDDKYDMIFGAANPSGNAIYILWDVINYKGKTIDITLSDIVSSANYKSLTVHEASSSDGLSTRIINGNAGPSLNFFKVDGHGSYEMINILPNANRGVNTSGGIYIVWNIADRAAKSEAIEFGSLKSVDKVLAINAASIEGKIGSKHPVFLDVDINNGAGKHDMVIIADDFGKKTGIPPNNTIIANVGAIYILWDVSDYAGATKEISLSNLGATANLLNTVTSGSLAIYGAKKDDQIEVHAPKFLQIDGNNNYDMVIRSEHVDKVVAGEVAGTATTTNEGAIYIFWDVGDYADPQAKTIDLFNPTAATSGLLTIYGRSGEGLGSDINNILYNNNGELTNIDKDTAGTKDIAFSDKYYTYILFGDKIADKGNGNKVGSKTIDLGAIETLLTADKAGFFAYDAVNSAIVASTSEADRLGYRFKVGSANLQTVQANYERDNPLSDADSGLEVWDIA